ncbi:hypothetical protein TRIUR3_13555 [Triticum urartu]|uniref:Uncharacterized protein n=1 Tax=Triticum urartu TaxID=4572 RepID=M7ZPG8_TRIUA|nr:hypothetical protein TRIUR3_13555 [Triticum urartu]
MVSCSTFLYRSVHVLLLGRFKNQNSTSSTWCMPPHETIERAHRSVMDYIKHALTLFTNFAIVLIIMALT